MLLRMRVGDRFLRTKSGEDADMIRISETQYWSSSEPQTVLVWQRATKKTVAALASIIQHERAGILGYALCAGGDGYFRGTSVRRCGVAISQKMAVSNPLLKQWRDADCRLILRQNTHLLTDPCPTVRQPALRLGFSSTNWALPIKTSLCCTISLPIRRNSSGDSGSGFTNSRWSVKC
jgi:hypothetical protein